MSIVGMVIVLIVIGAGLYLINAYVPMDPRIKGILTTLVIILVVIWAIALLFNVSIPALRLR